MGGREDGVDAVEGNLRRGCDKEEEGIGDGAEIP